jgi:hypothetical protein
VNTLVTIMVGILTAAATIAAAIIVARTPKREIHEVVIRDHRAIENERMPFSQALRVIGIVIVTAVVLVGTLLIDGVIMTWLDPSLFGPPLPKFLDVLFFGSAGFLFCIARWISNRLPEPLQISSDNEADNDEDD